jgi:hypothetical protein
MADPDKAIGDIIAVWARQGHDIPLRLAYTLAELAVAALATPRPKPAPVIKPWSDDPRSEGMGE